MKNLFRGICLVLIMCFFWTTIAVAQGQADNDLSSGLASGQISEEDMASILEKLNSGSDTNRRITALPMEATVEIPDDFVPDDTPYEHFYPEEMTDDEIEAVIERIANGENVLFGDGAPTDYADLLQLRWKKGSNGHQWITSRALTILQNDKSSVFNWFTTGEKAAMIEYSDWPDNNETSNTNSWHFYNYPTKKNYYQNYFDSHTAKSRFVYWYNQAVSAGRKANWVTAAQHLGKAIHYLSDLGTPPHTGDMTSTPPLPSLILAPKHALYEADAQSRRTQYAVSTTSYYSWYINANRTPANIADSNAATSYSYYANCYSLNSSLRNPTIEWPMKFVQQDIAGLLYRYYYDVNSGGYI